MPGLAVVMRDLVHASLPLGCYWKSDTIFSRLDLDWSFSLQPGMDLRVIGVAALLALVSGNEAGAQTIARGVVFHDRNENGKRDTGEPGVNEVRVSNQKEVVLTDAEGRWQLPCDEDTTFFVVKPRGWMTPVNEHKLPRFFYTHKPAGSPVVKFGGVAPTGPLPASIDFPLLRHEEPKTFKALFFGDTQPRNVQEVEFMAHDVVEELIGTDAKFGVTLGDIVFDDLSVFEPLNATIALIGIPWYNVLGNHDINYDVDHDHHADETFERIYGPSYYSFDYGPVHFIVLDDVIWEGQKPKGTGNYRGGLGVQQMEFVKNDLHFVPENQLVVLMMHIPLINVEDRRDLYRLIEKRPYTLSVSGHTHWQAHRFITDADGWQGAEPHHHVISVTVCGSWWAGAPGERGIPHAMMSDGAPNGYSVITFDERSAVVDFKAAGAPADHQMNIFAPEKASRFDFGQTNIYVNVFGGSERSTVRARLAGTTPWTALEKVLEEDPYFMQLKMTETNFPGLPGRKLPNATKSQHLWKGRITNALPAGTHRIAVETTDMYGRTFQADRAITITP
jgi:hypothetical protein